MTRAARGHVRYRPRESASGRPPNGLRITQQVSQPQTDLHGQGRDAFEFFTQQKVVVERWPKAWTRKF